MTASSAGIPATRAHRRARAVGWPESEVEQINAAHIAGADESTIRLLVENIHRERETACNA